MSMRTALVVALCVIFGITGLAIAQSDAPPVAPVDKSKYSPYPTQNFPNRVYFGDTHLHTALSTDAGMIGARLGPGRGVPVRARRDCDVEHRPSGEAQPPARFPRRR